MNHGQSKAGSWLGVLGWAAYLACSWTWCIGMFLPVLLVRDYGVWGFVVFAIPNCLGAAVSGIAMRDFDNRAWFLRSHGGAAMGFSLVTVAFQGFFAGWAQNWIPNESLLFVLPCLYLAAEVYRRTRTWSAALIAGAFATALTACTFIANDASGEAAIPQRDLPFGALGALAPVCAFGFALCPYLDLTFWRARAMAPGAAGNAAFLFGFLALFPVSILLTLAYAARLGDAGGRAAFRDSTSLAAVLIGAHLLVQLFVTVYFHVVELRTVAGRDAEASQTAVTRIPRRAEVFLLVGICTGAASWYLPALRGIEFSELVYRLFMGAYGLVFPAYVWLCVLPTWRTRSRPSVAALKVWIGACTLGVPMFWMGFVERREWWLLPGLGVVVLARLLIRPAPPIRARGASEPPEPSGAPVLVPSGPPSLSAHATPERDSQERPGSP